MTRSADERLSDAVAHLGLHMNDFEALATANLVFSAAGVRELVDEVALFEKILRAAVRDDLRVDTDDRMLWIEANAVDLNDAETVLMLTMIAEAKGPR